MSSSRPAIEALPPDVAAKIKSSTSITHLNGVIIELVKNSLDANARTVHVSVDFKRGSCIVEDDGDGIDPAEFEPSGGLGKAHHTSKFKVPDAHGHQGLFLASLASLSLLTVTSRHIQHETTNSIIFHRSAPVARLIPAPMHQDLRLGEHGTSVTVNDLFGNMPVRVKSRAIALQRPDEMEREWDKLRYSLVAIILANVQLAKLVMSDVERGKRIVICPGSSGATQLDLHRIGAILCQSGMSNSKNMESWSIISAAIPDLTVSAAISTVPSPSKRLQFISLGKGPVLSRGSSNILFNEVNRLMALSDFGSLGSIPPSNADRNSLPGRLSEAPSTASGRTWARPINKWPMFYIRIDTGTNLPFDEEGQISVESEKSIQRITDVLEAMISEFLRQQNLRPRMTNKFPKGRHRNQILTRENSHESRFLGPEINKTTEEAFSHNLKLPSFQRPSINTSRHFHDWSRVKTAKDLSINTRGYELPGESNATIQPRVLRDHRRSYDRRQNAANHFQPSTLNDQVPSPNAAHTTSKVDDLNKDSHHASDGLISWVDPNSGKPHLINSRTGQTVNRSEFITGPRPLQRLGDDKHGQMTNGIWLEGLLKTWENSTFSRTELPLQVLNPEDPSVNAAMIPHVCHQDFGHLETAQFAKFRGKLRRQSLETATIISQVDEKFILAKLHAANDMGVDNYEAVLVLIDQHAADERCRIERLFHEMFVPGDSSTQQTQVVTVEIEPIVFSVSPTEASIFKRHSSFFRKWGFSYDQLPETGSKSIISVYSVPSLVAERCRLEPDLVIDLLRREIWGKEEDGDKTHAPKSHGSHPRHHGLSETENMKRLYEEYRAEPTSMSHPWVNQMSGCPQGILDLLNSRACRGAIMFNDPLTPDECEVLVRRLARCAFPFQCAHGRPSMVPVLDLRPLPENCTSDLSMDNMAFDFNEQEETGLDFIEAFQGHYGKVDGWPKK